MYEGFSGQARKAIQLAHREAARLGHDYLGTEHLLLGIVREGSSGAVRLLAAFGTDQEKVYRDVEASLPRGVGAANWDKLPFTPGALRALEYARAAALELNHSCVGAEHLLLGVIEEADSSAAQFLLPLGFAPQLLRKELASLPEPENRDWMLRPEPMAAQPAATDPSVGELESVVSAAPLPSASAPSSEDWITGVREGRIGTPDIRLDIPVVERQLEALQILVCALGGALIGSAGLGGFGAILAAFTGAILAAFIGALVGCLLIAVKSNSLARVVGLGAGMVWGWLYGTGNPILAGNPVFILVLVLVGGGVGLILGFCLGDWRKLMGSPPEPPKTIAEKSVETFTKKT